MQSDAASVLGPPWPGSRCSAPTPKQLSGPIVVWKSPGPDEQPETDAVPLEVAAPAEENFFADPKDVDGALTSTAFGCHC